MHGIMLRQRPDLRLRPWVSHYWFSRGGAATHVVLPDGCVDLVVAISDRASTVWVYGTATQRTTLSTDPAERYLGVRFLPGQARHFLNMSAGELTDSAEQVSGQDALGLAGAPWFEAGTRDLFQGLDALLLGVLARRTPRRLALDRVLQRLHDTPHGSLTALAADSGLSRRQLERQCRAHVGVAPAQFAMIRRCHRVLSALSQTPAGVSLATLAAVAGYADQSHMTRELRRFTGLTPGALLRDGAGEDVAFVLADGSPASSH